MAEEEEKKKEEATNEEVGGKQAAGAEEVGASPSKRTRHAKKEKGAEGPSQELKDEHADLAQRYPVGTPIWVFCRKTEADEAVDPPLEEGNYFTASGALKAEVPLLAGEVTCCDLSKTVGHWEDPKALKLPPLFLAIEVCKLFPWSL